MRISFERPDFNGTLFNWQQTKPIERYASLDCDCFVLHLLDDIRCSLFTLDINCTHNGWDEHIHWFDSSRLICLFISAIAMTQFFVIVRFKIYEIFIALGNCKSAGEMLNKMPKII